MRQFILLCAVLLAAGPTTAEDLNERLSRHCYTELSFFCLNRKGLGPRLKCLKEHQDALTATCQRSVRRIEEALSAPKPAPTAPAPAAKVAAAQTQQQPFPSTLETHLSGFEGSVYVHLSGLGPNQFVKAERNIPLEKGDLIRTGTDGKAEIGVNAESVIELSANTDFQIGDLSSKATQWQLLLGGLVAKIHSLAQGQDMRFNTPTAVAAIRGTELWVKYGGGTTGVGVFDEGRVAVTASNGGRPVFLSPNQQTNVAAGKPPTPAAPLAVKADSRALMEQARSRAAQLKKEWKPMGPQAQKELRQLLASRTVTSGDNLPNVQDTQPKMNGGASAPAGNSPGQKPAGVAQHGSVGNRGKGRRPKAPPAKKNQSPESSSSGSPVSGPNGSPSQNAGAPPQGFGAPPAQGTDSANAAGGAPAQPAPVSMQGTPPTQGQGGAQPASDQDTAPGPRGSGRH